MYKLLGLLLLMAGCATSPPPIDWGFENFETVDAEAEFPRELPTIRPLGCLPSPEDCQLVGYTTTAEVDVLEAYKITAEGNTEIAQANAEVVNLLIQQQKELVAAGVAEENIRKIREEQLSWTRSEMEKQKWFYRGVLVLLAAVGIYAN